MNYATTIPKILIGTAFALLAQLASAQSVQSGDSMGQGKVSQGQASEPLQFKQLPEFTGPQEGADELIGHNLEWLRRPKATNSPAVGTWTQTPMKTGIVNAPASQAVQPPVVEEPRQFAFAPEPLSQGTWKDDSYTGSGVVTAGSDWFAERSGDRSGLSAFGGSVFPLVKASAIESVGQGASGLSLTAPKTLELTEPRALLARRFEPKAAAKAKEPATKASKPPAKKTAKAAKAAKKAPAKKDGSNLPHVLLGAKNFKLADQPKQGAHFRDDTPITDPLARQIETINDDFSSGPTYDSLPYLSNPQQNVYAGKTLYANQRPLVELGRPWYQLGQLSEGYSWFGNHNRISPQFLVYGDFRTAVASNNVGGDGTTLFASELNLDIDLKLTGTERFHAFVSPLDNGVQNTGFNFDDDEFVTQFDANIDFGYFEGDLGAMLGGLTGETLPFDLPFAIGVMPLLIQNGVWFDDAFLGVAATLPARNSARFDISNMDITLFAGFDKISSDAFPGDDGAARLYGMASFIEAANGYFEIDYAFLEDRADDNRSYHNFAFAFTRRYGRLISNSTRIIVNAGQSTDVVENTADGVLLLSENSLITGAPSTVVPYFNFFAGFDRPQSAARAAAAGGVLRNTGILFESDGLTGYPTLDATANDTYGAALGLNLLANDFSQQLLVEVAALGVIGDDDTRNAPGGQFGVGFRYQLPLTNSLILRTDGMYGFLDNADDISGIRMELRQKW